MQIMLASDAQNLAQLVVASNATNNQQCYREHNVANVKWIQSFENHLNLTEDD